MATRGTDVQPGYALPSPTAIQGVPFPGTMPLPPSTPDGLPPGTLSATTSPTATSTTGGDFASQIMNALKTGYPGRDQSFYDQQLQYYLGKKNSSDPDEASRPADYWVQRAMGMGAGGADVATAGPYAGQNALAGGGGFSGASSTPFQMPAGFSNSSSSPLASFSAPGLLAPWTQTFQSPGNFVAPSAADVMNSPAVQARLGLGQDALQRSAAARGTLLTGSTLKDLSQFAQDLASQEYGNEWNRQFQANNNAYDRALNEYGLNENTFFNNANNAYNKLAGFTNLGLNGANSLGGYGSQYANTMQGNANQQSNLLTGQGQANAGNALASANNSNATLSGLANSAGSIDWSKLFRSPRNVLPGTPLPNGGTT